MRVTGVSFSSDRKLSRCEMQFSYRYDQKLKPRIKSKGLYMGAVMHNLLEAYRRKQDWVKVYKTFVKESWDKLFDEEREMYEEKHFTPQRCFDLMTHYVEHWGAKDADLKPIMIEQDLELTTRSGMLVRFKADYIARDGKSVVLFENKNRGEIPESDERILAPQPHSYCYLLSKMTPPILVTRIVWDYIRTEPVTAPKILKNGEMSKAKINTDQRTYLRVLAEAGIHPKGDEIVGLENHLRSLPETLSLARVVNKPNLKLGEMYVRDWVERANRAKLITRPTRSIDKSCNWCDYKILCHADMLGTPDRNTIIKRDFVTNIKKAGA